MRQPASTAWPLPGFSGCDGDTDGPLDRGPDHSPSCAISSPAASAVGRFRSTPSSSARNPRTRRSGVALVCSAGSNGRIRPSQLTNAPPFSTTGATGKTTSARSVTALSRSSRLSTNGAASIAARAASGSGRSASSTPPTSSAPNSPLRAASMMPAVSRPGVLGSSPTCHPSAVCSRAVTSLTGRPPGSRPGSAPASRAPRSPARRGIHASRAPVAAANLPAAESAPGEVARRSPTRMTAPGSFRCASSTRESSAAPSPPGTVAISWPRILPSERVANGAIAFT